MHSKLAGHLPLQDMIAQTLESARSKLAAAEEKDSKVKKLVEYEKKEHGGKIPTVKEEEEEEKEKKSSVLDFSDPDEMSKLASALEEMGDELLKEADSVENGGESHQGGEQLATMSPVGGKQVYTGKKAKHQVPMSTGMQAGKDNPGASTAVPTDDNRAPGGTGAKYPAKGVLKTAEFPPKKDEEKGEKKAPPFAKKEEKKDEGEEKKEKKSGVAALQAVVEKVAEEKTANPALTGLAVQGLGGMVGHHYGKEQKKRGEDYSFGVPQAAGALLAPGGLGYQIGRHIAHHDPKIEKGKSKGKEKKSEAVDFILGKIAEYHGGGETLDSASGQGPKPESGGSNSARKAIESNSAAIAMKKVDGKGPQKKQLSEVLSEPAQTKSTDSTVQDNLRNAAKGGVKIAAVKDYLRKIAEAGCVCAGAGECDYCRMKASVEKKRADKKVKQSLGMPPAGPAPSAGGPMGGSPGGM
jgi:hypothetical protein